MFRPRFPATLAAALKGPAEGVREETSHHSSLALGSSMETSKLGENLLASTWYHQNSAEGRFVFAMKLKRITSSSPAARSSRAVQSRVRIDVHHVAAMCDLLCGRGRCADGTARSREVSSAPGKEQTRHHDCASHGIPPIVHDDADHAPAGPTIIPTRWLFACVLGSGGDAVRSAKCATSRTNHTAS